MVAMGKAITKMRYMVQMKRMLWVRTSEKGNLDANVQRVVEVGELTGEEGENRRVRGFRRRDEAVDVGLQRVEERAQRRGSRVGLLAVGLHIRFPVCDEEVVGGNVEVVLDGVRVGGHELGEILELDGHANARLPIQGPDIRLVFKTQHRNVQGGFGE